MIISYIFTPIGAFIVFLTAIILLSRYIIRSLVFPGSNLFIRKMVEYNIRENMTRIIMNTVCNLKYTLEDSSSNLTLSENNICELVDSITDVKKMIESIISNNDRQRQLKNLSSDQEAFQQKLEDLKHSISSIRLLKPGGNMINISIWEADESEIEQLEGSNYSNNFRVKMTEIDSFCVYLSENMDIEYKSSQKSN